MVFCLDARGRAVSYSRTIPAPGVSPRMPSNSPRNAVARHWELLKRLPSAPPGRTTTELTLQMADAGYDVTKRTIERDLEGLEDLFPITHGDAEPFGWHWVKGSAFGVMGLSTTDALSLHLLERHLKPILPTAAVRQLQPVFDLAGQKLAAQKSSNTLGGWADKVAVVEASLAVLPAPIDPAALQVIQECLLAEEQVEIDYLRPGTQAPRARVLHPLGLVLCGAITYLVATTQVHKAPQTYALHRVHGARRLHCTAARPDGFSLQTFIAEGGLQFGATRAVQLQAWVSTMLGAQLAETRLCDNQRLAPADDGFILTATLRYSWRLRWWLLSKSGDIEVLAPTDLRQEIAELLMNAAARYGRQVSPTTEPMASRCMSHC